jgi:hypothetical protein
MRVGGNNLVIAEHLFGGSLGSSRCGHIKYPPIQFSLIIKFLFLFHPFVQGKWPAADRELEVQWSKFKVRIGAVTLNPEP